MGDDTSLPVDYEPFAQPVESGSLSDINPTSGDVFQLTRLPIYMGGNIVMDTPPPEGHTTSGSGIVGNDDPSGCILGRLDPEFSPLKTRSARRKKGLIADTSNVSSPCTKSPWALREQKALARGST